MKNQHIDHYVGVFQVVTFFILINVITSIYISSLVYMTQQIYQKFALICISHKNGSLVFRNVTKLTIFGVGLVARQLRTNHMCI